MASWKEAVLGEEVPGQRVGGAALPRLSLRQPRINIKRQVFRSPGFGPDDSKVDQIDSKLDSLWMFIASRHV